MNPEQLQYYSLQLLYYNLLVQIVIAVSITLTVIVALFQENIKKYLSRPQLTLSLRTEEGNLTKRSNNIKTIYFHLLIKNRKPNRVSINTKICCLDLIIIGNDKSFHRQPITTPLPLRWAFDESLGQLRNVIDSDICDIGYIDENDNKFIIDFLFRPNNVRGYILGGETALVKLNIRADNFHSTSIYCYKIYWNGKWTEVIKEMDENLNITKIQDLAKYLRELKDI